MTLSWEDYPLIDHGERHFRDQWNNTNGKATMLNEEVGGDGESREDKAKREINLEI